MIKHHPALDLLTDYATGALAEGQALSIACHVALCEQCRHGVSALEQVGGDLLEELDPVAVDRDALDTVLARLDEPYSPPPPPVVDDETRQLLPSPLWHYVEGRLSDLRWRRVTPTLSSARIALSRARHRVDILRIAAGRAVPRHTHDGDELTLVLAGGFSDDTGHFVRGDFARADAGLTHRPVADAGDDCIALAVLDAPVVPTGTIGKMLRPLMRG
jgi:putative transcriptional regulator